jgi:hypothetical protein
LHCGGKLSLKSVALWFQRKAEEGRRKRRRHLIECKNG